jgi:hypothetical protein
MVLDINSSSLKIIFRNIPNGVYAMGLVMIFIPYLEVQILRSPNLNWVEIKIWL